MPDAVIRAEQVQTAPAGYTVPQAQEIVVKSVRALVDGTGASGNFLAVLQLVAPDDSIVWESPTDNTIAVGGTANVSWFPHVASNTVTGVPTAGVIIEEFFLDTRTTGATSSTTLLTGVPYIVTVQGTYSKWNSALNDGTPNADAMFPTTGPPARNSTQVGCDADTQFAAFNIPGTYPYHIPNLEMNLGSGYVHVEPQGGPYSAPQANYLYRYSLTGQGAALSLRINDSPISDNYGELQVTIQGLSGGSSGGGGGGSLLPPDGSANALMRAVSGIPTWEAQPNITEADLSLSNVTTADVTTGRHGLAPILPNDATKYLDGTGAYTVPTGAAGITDLTSTGSTITVTSPTGPTANVDLPTTGVAAGSYGSSTLVPTFTVDAEGRLTAASTIAIGPSASYLLFSSTLLVDTASIDTGAGGIAGGFNILEGFVLVRTDDAGAGATILLTFNNDGGANYIRTLLQNVNTTLSGNSQTGQTAISLDAHGSGGSSSEPSISTFTIPGYTLTTFNKVLRYETSRPDATAANNAVVYGGAAWLSTAAITRLKVAASGTAKLKAGSSLFIYGR